MPFHLIFLGFCLGSLARSQLPEQVFLGLMYGLLGIVLISFIFPKVFK